MMSCPHCGLPLPPRNEVGTVADIRASMLCGDRIPREYLGLGIFTEDELLAAGWKKNIATGEFRRSLLAADNAACERG